MNSVIWKLGICVLIPVVILFLPVPAGLSVGTWQIFAMYIAAILGLMLRPFPEPVVIFAVIAVSSLLFKNMSVLLSGFASSVVWLVFSAFMIGTAIVETKLGRRIAYLLIGKLGRSTLGLGYVAAFTDLALSPGTPSNTARSGGIVYPIFRSAAVTLGSEPGPTGRRVGGYLTLVLYQISLTTGYIFMTAIAPNFLIASFADKILKVKIDWLMWAPAAIVPGMIALLLIPWVVFKLYPPELKTIDHKALSAKGLAELGPMSRKEKILAVLFVLAVALWATSYWTKIDSTAVAVGFVAACLLTGVVTWETLVSAKSAWSTFIWFGGIIGLAEGLSKGKFFEWLAQILGKNLNLAGYDQVVVMGILVLLSLAVRYLFASMTAYVITMIPVFLTIGLVAKSPALPLTYLIGFAASYGCLLTHYGGALGPVLFGTGYVSQVTWWRVGAIIVIMSFIIHMAVGLPYWKLIGLW